MMKTIFFSLFFQFVCLLGVTGPVSASELPPCPSSGYFHICLGTYTYGNGGKYVGEWRDGKRHGQGNSTYANGDKYVGEFKNDKRHGQGTYTYGPNSKLAGDKYVGEYKDNQRHGQGTYTFADGGKYVGEFNDGKFHGQGNYTHANGSKNVGEYKNGALNGYAIRYHADGSIFQEGIFKNNKFVYASTTTFSGVSATPTMKEALSTAKRMFEGHAIIPLCHSATWIYSGNRIFWDTNDLSKGFVKGYAAILAKENGYDCGIGPVSENELICYQATTPSLNYRSMDWRGTNPADYANPEYATDNKIAIDKAKRRGLKCNVGILFPPANGSNDEIQIAQNPTPMLPLSRPQQRKLALLIGNAEYLNGPLDNPVNDARLIGNTLTSLGFEVYSHENADLKTMKRAIRDFGKKLESAGEDAVGLFYFAGHGLQSEGENYLSPIGAQVRNEADVEIEMVSANAILKQMEFARNGLNIVILDACRVNRFSRGFRSPQNGLANMDAPTGSILAYATAPGTVAYDGRGDNSPYAGALAEAMLIPNTPIEAVFKQVRISVINETDEKQVPWESSSLIGEFMFNKIQSSD